MTGAIEVVTVEGLPEIESGSALGALVADAGAPRDGDVVVISQKVVSKAEGRVVALDSIDPSDEAAELASRVDKDPRMVELVLRESRRIVRAEGGVLITETRSGWVCANAGVDASNLAAAGEVALLPEDADASARRLRAQIAERAGTRPAVVVSDSFGRPWRLGQTDVAIGCAGLRPLDDWRGRGDRQGRELSATLIAVADQAAAAADLVREKDSGTPVAIVRGLDRHVTADDGPGAVALQRPADEDLFR
jgi:coenzyme F420-0:L-glutamate ligase / coenzyme F420-1:gamma-L-glutamate ligase